MTPTLKAQLEQESKDYAQKQYEQFENKKHMHLKTMMYYAHLAGAKEYAEKWQEAEQRALKFEKALNYIGAFHKGTEADVVDCETLEQVYNIMIETAREALTPKTGSDDQV